MGRYLHIAYCILLQVADYWLLVVGYTPWRRVSDDNSTANLEQEILTRVRTPSDYAAAKELGIIGPDLRRPNART
jgi:hypothetical protein